MENGGLSSYQLMIQRNIEENKRVLQSLGLSFGTHYQPKEKPAKPRCVRKSVSKTKEQQATAQVYSRSTRIQTRRSSSILETTALDDSAISSDLNNGDENTPPQKKPRSEPVFGEIEGVRVGDWWPSRLDCSAAGVHRPTVAGIHGKQGEGCYSIALSGGYEDDLDCGTYFTYTGCGGRDLKGTKCNPKNLRTAPQSKDQVFEGLNAALASNIESNKPVRVIRGFKLQSDFAPEEGYRYDGLYSVEKYWTATGLSGFKVYKYALKRLQDQDPAPWESCIQPEPSSSKELPVVEVNNQSHIDKMDATKSISPLKSSPSKLSTRGRPRKQTCPKQHCQNGFNKSIISDDFSKEFDQESANDGKVQKVPSFEETLKETENVIHCTKNNLDSFPVKDPEDVHETTPTKRSFKEYKSQIDDSTVNMSEKKVRFSQSVQYMSEVDNEDIQDQEVEGDEDIQEVEGEEVNRKKCIIDLKMIDLDGKKQASILRYFSRKKRVVEKHPLKTTINPKSLRSNCFTSTLTSPSNNIPKYCHELNSKIPSPSCTSETSAISNVTNSDIKLNGSFENMNRSSSHKRKYSSFTKHKEFDLDLHTLSEKSPTMMENLIKQNNEKLKLHKHITPKKRKCCQEYPVKPCSVILKRIKIQDFNESDDSVFLGWDLEVKQCLGFSEADLKEIKMKRDKFLECINNIGFKTEKDTREKLTEGFYGWDVNKDDFQGTSGLVPIGFMIDKLSKS